MSQITVGYVSGFIALGVFIVQHFCPNLIAFIAAGLLGDDETAATWTTVTPVLQGSLWTYFLRSDASRTHGVRRGAILITHSVTVAAALVAIVGVVTPLGLREGVGPGEAWTPDFFYHADPSTFGIATPPRSDNSWTRICFNGESLPSFPITCPYSEPLDNADSIDAYNVTLPQMIYDIYSSGTRHLTTVSNFFDIQWRQYRLVTGGLNNGSTYMTNDYRFVSSLVLNNATDIIEGLIVDTKNGGIGFRNHTLPDTSSGFRNATWEEDLLFVEPQTTCVDTNLTIDYTISNDFSEPGLGLEPWSEIYLVDHGGFVDLDTSIPAFAQVNSQNDPDLRGRAYKAAYLNNVWTMAYMNITNINRNATENNAFAYINSARGQRFNITWELLTTLGSTLISPDFGGYVVSSLSPNDSNSSSNPFDVTRDDFEVINIVCSGSSPVDIANISNVYAACGLMYGASKRVDNGSRFLFNEIGSRWSTPLYACSSVLRASIHTTSFRFNGEGLNGLEVLESRPKEYADTSDMPLWGMEDAGLNLSQIKSVWGIVDSAFENYPNISVTRKPEFYLPGYFSTRAASINLGTGVQYVPGAEFGQRCMDSTYRTSELSVTPSTIDYTGTQNMGMLMRWQELSANAADAGKIINLIWTDIAANAVVGTKGVLGANNMAPEQAPISVVPYNSRINYSIPYAVPAIVLATFLFLLVLATITMAILGHSRAAVMRRRLNQTSVGRIMTTVLHPDQSSIDMGSREWSRTNGQKRIDLGGSNVQKGAPVSRNVYTVVPDGPEVVDSRATRSDGSDPAVDVLEHKFRQARTF